MRKIEDGLILEDNNNQVDDQRNQIIDQSPQVKTEVETNKNGTDRYKQSGRKRLYSYCLSKEEDEIDYDNNDSIDPWGKILNNTLRYDWEKQLNEQEKSEDWEKKNLGNDQKELQKGDSTEEINENMEEEIENRLLKLLKEEGTAEMGVIIDNQEKMNQQKEIIQFDEEKKEDRIQFRKTDVLCVELTI